VRHITFRTCGQMDCWLKRFTNSCSGACTPRRGVALLARLAAGLGQVGQALALTAAAARSQMNQQGCNFSQHARL